MGQDCPSQFKILVKRARITAEARSGYIAYKEALYAESIKNFKEAILEHRYNVAVEECMRNLSLYTLFS
jgi:hypothetical protein